MVPLRQQQSLHPVRVPAGQRSLVTAAAAPVPSCLTAASAKSLTNLPRHGQRVGADQRADEGGTADCVEVLGDVSVRARFGLVIVAAGGSEWP